MACPKGTTADGFETQFGTNHLGHFVFVNRIAGLLKAGGRLVNLSSGGHLYSDVDLDDPNFERTPYTEFGAYGRSKTANILFAVEFDRRHKAAGIRATAVHPGAIHTELGRYMTPEVIKALMDQMAAAQTADGPGITFKSVQQGAATSVWAACVAPADVVGGRYCEDCHVAETAANVGFGGGVLRLCGRSGQRPGPVGQERGDGRRALLSREAAGRSHLLFAADAATRSAIASSLER